jgi:hypothetical protein
MGLMTASWTERRASNADPTFETTDSSERDFGDRSSGGSLGHGFWRSETTAAPLNVASEPEAPFQYELARTLGVS